MKNILLILGSPRNRASYSHQIGRRIIDDLKSRYPSAKVVVRNLAKEFLPDVGEAFVTGRVLAQGKRSDTEAEALALSDVMVAEPMGADVLVLAKRFITSAYPHPRKSGYRRWPKPPEECEPPDPFVFRARHMRCRIAGVLNSLKVHRDEFDNGCRKGAGQQEETRGTASCRQSHRRRTPRDVDHDSDSSRRRRGGRRRICHIDFRRAGLAGHRYARRGFGGARPREHGVYKFSVPFTTRVREADARLIVLKFSCRSHNIK
jgi:hypothetical protein